MIELLAGMSRARCAAAAVSTTLCVVLGSIGTMAARGEADGQAQPPPAQAPAQPAPGAPPPPQSPGGPPSAGQDAQQPAPVFRTGINLVRVDVIVSDKQGNPVVDLTKDDFQLFEDGKPQTVDTFRRIDLDGNPPPGEAPRAIRNDFDEETEAQREDVRIFVILLDDYHVRRGASMGVRTPMINFIRNQLGPMDLVGLMYPLTPVSDVRLTRNHEGVIRAIEKFEGRKFDYRPRNAFEEQYSMYPTEVVERVRNQVSLSALRGLAVRLGGLREGRKAIILVSEGFTYYVPPQKRDPVAEMPGMGNPNSRRPMAGDGNLNEERYQFFQSVDMQSDLREVYNAANRANTAIYTLDPRGLAVFEYDINESVGGRTDRNVLNETIDTLRTLASETDGRAIVNRNDLEGGLKQVVRDSSAYYLIGYNSTQAPTDGKFHEIKVKLKRPGLQVRARKGYWALTAEETTRVLTPKPAPEAGVTKALATVEAKSRSRMVRTWIGTTAAGDGRTRVTFVWEPVPPVPGEERRAAPARVSVVAAGPEGSAYFRGKIPEDGAAPAEGAASSAARGGRAVFDADPGSLQLRLSIEDPGGQVLDSDMMDVQVPDYTAPQVALSTLAVYRVRTARELQALNTDPGAMPAATREFRRTDRLLIRFEATGPGSTVPTTEARLLNRAGQAMTTLPVQPSPQGNSVMQVDLPLAGLPAGEFILEVKASDGAGGGEAKQFVGFRVVS